MSSVTTTVIILLISCLSVVATSVGLVRHWYIFLLGMVGISMTTYTIFALHFPWYRVVLHLLVLVLLSILGYSVSRKYPLYARLPEKKIAKNIKQSGERKV